MRSFWRRKDGTKSIVKFLLRLGFGVYLWRLWRDREDHQRRVEVCGHRGRVFWFRVWHWVVSWFSKRYSNDPLIGYKSGIALALLSIQLTVVVTALSSVS